MDELNRHFRVVIPARFESTRLPGKPLRRIAGKTMLEHVYAIAKASGAGEVVIATDDARIVEAAKGLGADVVLTAADHPSGSDRIAEVVSLRGWTGDSVVVNVQCDEPLLPPQLIDQVAGCLSEEGDLATLAVPLSADDPFDDPNVVKLVMDGRGRALYFSRAPIPYHRDDPATPRGMYRHIGLYAYRVESLLRLCALPPCPLEQTERLEQLRALHAGMRIDVDVASAQPGPGVDTPRDLEIVENLMRVAT